MENTPKDDDTSSTVHYQLEIMTLIERLEEFFTSPASPNESREKSIKIEVKPRIKNVSQTKTFACLD